jgi:hypothetical protein
MGVDKLQPNEKAIYDEILAIYSVAENQAASEMRSIYADPSSRTYWPEMASVLSGKSDGVVLDEEASSTPPEVSTGVVTEQLPGSETLETDEVVTPDIDTALADEPTKSPEGTSIAYDTGLPVGRIIIGTQMITPTKEIIDNVRERFPLEGGENPYAKAYFAKIQRGETTFDSAIRDAKSLGYPDEWVARVSDIIISLEEQEKAKRLPVAPPTQEEIFGAIEPSYSTSLGKTPTEMKQLAEEKRFGSGLMQRSK